MLLLDSVNSYLGAWVTAGVALGGLLVAAIQSIATAVAKYNIAKMESDNAVEIEKQKTQQKELAIKQAKIKDVKTAFNDYYVQTALSIYKKEKIEKQILAYGELLPYVSGAGFHSKFRNIQESIDEADFGTADNQFHIYLPTLKSEEKQLLSRLEEQTPTERKADYEDPQAEPQKKH